MVEDALTFDNPGSIGVRDVPARRTRIIFVIPLGVYFIENCLRGLYDIMNKYTEFATTDVVGRVILDHYREFVATGEGSGEIVSIDFKQWDTSQRYENTRIYAINGVNASLLKKGIIGKWGPWNSFGEAITLVWKKYRSAWFQMKGLNTKGIFEAVKFDCNQVLSGENITLAENSINHKALAESLFSYLTTKPYAWKLAYVDLSFIGDDGSYIIKGNVFDELELKDFADTLVKYYHDCGYATNVTKTAIRRHFSEYQKICVVYGWYIPRLQTLQILGGERPNPTLSIIDWFKGYVQFLNVWISRGGREEWTYKYLLAVWLIRRFDIYDIDGVRRRKRIPFNMLFAPIRLGGVGRLPNVMRGANLDALIYLKSNNEERFAINSAISRYVKPNSIKQSLAEAILDGPSLKKGVNFIEKHLDMTTLRNAYKADQFLQSKNIKTKFDYRDSAYQQVFTAVRDSPRLKDFDNLVKYSTQETKYQDWLGKEFPWLEKIKFEFTSEIKEVIPFCPIVGLDPYLEKMIKTFGIVGRKGLTGTQFSKVFSALRASPNFPSYIRAEQIAEQVSRPDILFNQEVLVNVLIKMGATEDIAIRTANNIIEHLNEFLFMSNSKSFSINDSLGSWMDFSMTRVLEIVEIPPIDADQLISNMLYQLGMCLVYTIPYGSKIRKVKISAELPDLLEMYKFLSNYFYEPTLKYWPAYPETEL